MTNTGIGLIFGIDNSVVATISGSMFTGPVIAGGGLSGSLQTLTDGITPYAVGIGLVTVTTGSNGQVVIDVADPFPTYALPSSSIVVSQDMASDFYLNVGTLTTSSYATLTGSGATAGQELTFWLEDVIYPYTINNATGSIFTTSQAIPVKVDVKFDGNDWHFESFKRLTPSFEHTLVQMGLLLDIDPSQPDTLTLSGSSLLAISNAAYNGIDFVMSSSGHSPTWNPTGWPGGLPSIQFAGPTSYPSFTAATQFLVNDDAASAVLQALSYSSSDWKTLTVFCVAQPVDYTDAREQDFYSMSGVGYGSGWTTDYVTGPDGEFNNYTYNDDGSTSAGFGLTLSDNNSHIQVMTTDGTGNISWWIDGTQVGSTVSDVSPKTVTRLLLGAGIVVGEGIAGQLTGQVVRFMVFNTSLTTAQRNVVLNYLGIKYGTST